MAYCGPRGIPLSQFLDWDEQDQDAALMWAAAEARRCGGCGTLPEEWDPEQGGDRFAYEGVVVSCPGCRAAHSAQQTLNRRFGGELKPWQRIALVADPAPYEDAYDDD